jgi:alpha-tubulin N-acetyltransferase 1
MEFNFNCEQVLGCNANTGIAILEGTFQTAIKPGYTLFVNQIIDQLGYASSTAQGLNTIITTASKFFSSNHRIFIRAKENKVIGFIKVGVKKLFIRDQFTNFHEINPLCVLDFYVHESEQRNGHGKVIKI